MDSPVVVSLIIFFFSTFSASACDHCVFQAQASSFSGHVKLESGSCGYKSIDFDGFNDGFFAYVPRPVYKRGVTCGACYQVRCTNAIRCSKHGVRVLVAGVDRRNEAGFVLGRNAFDALSIDGNGKELSRTVDVEYKRVPCDFEKKMNLSLRVEETSRFPSFLSVQVLYQGGKTDMTGIDIAQVGSIRWDFMSRSVGDVAWHSKRVPRGALQFRFMFTSGFDGKWAWAKNALPADWAVGKIYDTGIQITDVAQEGCYPCSDGKW